ncbi:hypothetical protein NTG1052_210117 [Candidatus Nitrotoga sp. 1052]|nr:hypothetical protein NTG1052_210117 [Candidatus Nitrotoga sp. 1052]
MSLIHAASAYVKALVASVRAGLQHFRATTSQLLPVQRWKALACYIVEKITAPTPKYYQNACATSLGIGLTEKYRIILATTLQSCHLSAKIKIKLFYLLSHSSELNLEESLNTDLKHAICSKVPAHIKAKLKAAATTEHMQTLEQSLERVKKLPASSRKICRMNTSNFSRPDQ